MEKEQNFCQSCGMPLADANDFGTNADGSLNEEYCKYCFVDGKFVQQCTMDEMIEHCAQFVEEFNKDSEHKVTRKEAIGQISGMAISYSCHGHCNNLDSLALTFYG